MNLEMQKRLSAKVAKVGVGRVRINPENIDQVKEAITKADIRDLIDNKVIEILPLVRNSKARARLRAKAKKKGRQSGPGSKVGTKNARTPTKRVWINRIRLQRKIIKSLVNKKNIHLLMNTDYLILQHTFWSIIKEKKLPEELVLLIQVILENI